MSSFDEHLVAMGHPGTYVAYLEVVATAVALDRRISVVAGSERWVFNRDASPGRPAIYLLRKQGSPTST
eukprot:6258054-Alexandrium_andersonii.AAC.1